MLIPGFHFAGKLNLSLSNMKRANINTVYGCYRSEMAEQNSDFKRFFVRLGVTVAAVVLVMYLAKVWFIDQQANIQKISKYSFVYSRGNSQPAIRSLKFTLTGYLFCGIFL